MSAAIEMTKLTKQYPAARSLWRPTSNPPYTAVSEVSLRIDQGEMFGLLGPNGAGKTTLTKMLCTLILPTSGQATVAGYALTQAEQIRAAVGLVVTDERSFYWRLSAYHNLRFFAALHGLYGQLAEQRIQQLLQDVGLQDFAHRRFSNYSTGMKQRVAIARALLHQPSILFLDEPSRSLDPTATDQLHQLVAHLRATRQMTIFLITHDLQEAEKLCERVAVMYEGRLQTVGEPHQLRHQLERQLQYEVRVTGNPSISKLQGIFPQLHMNSAAPGETLLRFQAGERDGRLTTLIDLLRHDNHQILSIVSQPPTLEEVFRHYTQPSAVTL